MPYIESKMQRTVIDKSLEHLNYSTLDGVGELNYAITRLISNYLGPEVSYTRLNEIIGVLECSKLEFYRRVVVSYEQTKMEENGDVY